MRARCSVYFGYATLIAITYYSFKTVKEAVVKNKALEANERAAKQR